MNPTDFVGRHQEIELLDRLWDRNEATLFVLYGRRRVGKTRLLTHWIKRTGHRTLYWVADPSTAAGQLRSFSQAVSVFADPQGQALQSFTYENWQQAWRRVAALARDQRLALFFDEFTYLLEADPAIAGIFQNIWDHELKTSNLFLVLSGSHMGMMERHALSYQAPLYGRATAALRLQPLPFGVTGDYFPHYDADQRVAIYAMFGGIPAYWERLDSARTISDNIRTQLLAPQNLMQAEPRLLLQDFLKTPQNYIAIFEAIAGGARTQKEIVSRTLLSQSHVSSYLGVLQDAGYVERRVPVTERGTSRRGRYHITDPYLRFYYRFLASRQAQLALGLQDQALAEITRHLRDFIGVHTWEELCREWLLRASAYGEFPHLLDQVGAIWTKQAQVDVAGVNSMEKVLVLGECKWGDAAVGRNVLSDLMAKTDAVVPKQRQWHVVYIGFARNGWTAAAVDFARQVEQANYVGRNWRAGGMTLLDLEQVDSDLHRWSTPPPRV